MVWPESFWTLQPTGLASYTYDLTVEYNDGEIAEAGGDETALVLAYWDGTKWVPVASSVDQATNRITASGLTHFSDWAVGTAASVPVKLVSFTVD